MEAITAKRKMRRMRILFLSFALLIPLGLLFALGTRHQLMGVIVFIFGSVTGAVCAFTTCPCCSQLSGIFAKGIWGGMFPFGYCVHCGDSYLRANGCGNDSYQISRADTVTTRDVSCCCLGRRGSMRHGYLLPILTLLFSAAVSAAQMVPAAAMLAAHNKVRSQHGLPPLSWSTSLAKNAGLWANHLAKEQGCRMQHAKGTGQGENLFWASAATWSDGRREVQSVTPAQVVRSWVSEEADYDYASNSCRSGKACGHYTQIVWKNSTRVGCAKRICSDKSQIWVCRYLPPGNWIGRKPY